MVRYDYRQRYPSAAEALQAVQPLGFPERPLPIASPRLLPPTNQVVPPTMPPTSTPVQSFTVQQNDPQLNSPTAQNPLTLQDNQSSGSSAAVQAPLSRQESRNRQALLSKVNNYWIKGVLETSLHDQVLMALGIEERPDAIASPWNLALETRSQPARTLPSGTPIISVFDQIGSGRSLLILGEPGAGKTTTLLQLTRELLRRAEQDDGQLIPVVLNLSSWSGQRRAIAQRDAGAAFANWLVEELNTKYQVPKKIGQPWVEQQQLLLLLDGLDEVRAADRDACVVALNQFQQNYGTEMVVCSRIKDYEALANRLNLQSAIYLRALTPEQIHHYLRSLSADLTGLRRLLEQDTTLQELTRSPLMLNIVVLAYQGVTDKDLPKTNTVEERRKQLFDLYLEQMFKRRGSHQKYSQPQTLHWLIWLAQQISRQSQTVFLIEQMQPAWLSAGHQRHLYSITSGLIFGLVYGLMFGISHGIQAGLVAGLAIGLVATLSVSVTAGLMHELCFWVDSEEQHLFNLNPRKWAYSAFNGLISGIFLGLSLALTVNPLAGLIVGITGAVLMILIDGITDGIFAVRSHNIQAVDALKWSWKTVRNSAAVWLGFGLLVGPFLGIVDGRPLIGILAGLLYGLFFGVVNGLSYGAVIETKITPNQGIWQSAKNAAIISVAGISVMVLTVSLLQVSRFWIFSAGVLPALLAGGIACIDHLALRLVLYFGGWIPWNYAQFLNYASDRIFLQKVGGGYIFIHRLLMEHVAAISLEE